MRTSPNTTKRNMLGDTIKRGFLGNAKYNDLRTQTHYIGRSKGSNKVTLKWKQKYEIMKISNGN